MLELPNADFALIPEQGYSKEAIGVAKRRPHGTLESSVRSSNYTRRAIRDYERSAKRYGDTAVEETRLLV